MATNQRNMALAVGAILFGICVCIAIFGFGNSIFFFSRNQIARIDPFSSPTAAEADLNYAGTETPSSEALLSDELPEEVVEQMRIIEKQVVAIRNLQPNGDFIRAVLSTGQLQERVTEDFLADYSIEDAKRDVIVLSTFGLLNSEFDLHAFYIDLLSEQVIGIYDDETKEMLVVQDKTFSGPEKLTYAHEYVHALQDQNFDIKNGLQFSDEICEQEVERCSAVRALLEGDATFLEFEWFVSNSTRDDKREIQVFYDTLESPVFDSAPGFLREDFIFPYTAGLDFVEYLHEEGGYPAIDAAYRNPPISTEQILHPDRFPDDKPIPVSLPKTFSALEDSWDLVESSVMGEWYTFLILAFGTAQEARLNERVAREAAEGWGGDSYSVYNSQDSTANILVMKTMWDSIADANEFALAFREYATIRFGNPSSNEDNKIIWHNSNITTLFVIDGKQTFWIAGPELNLTREIWETLNGS